MRGRPLVYAVLGLAAGLLAVGLLLGRSRDGGRNRIPLVLRMMSSALVWLAALLIWRTTPPGPRRRQAALTAAGMGLGTLGDLVMARVIPLPQHVAFGMLAFGAGHTCYIRAASARLRELAPEQRPLQISAPALSLALSFGGTGWGTLVRSPATPPPLQAAALAYTLLLSTTTGMAGGLALRDGRYIPLALGAALFLLSDLILAGELFRELFFAGIGDTIWLTYIAGQGLIVTTLGLADELPAGGAR